MLIMGIDPGKNGAIVVLNVLGELVKQLIMPLNLEGEPDISFLVSSIGPLIEAHRGEVYVYIERAQAMPKQGVVSMFNYGKGYGKLLGYFEGVNVPIFRVQAQRWKKVVLSAMEHTKEGAIEFCRRFYPTLNLLRTPQCTKPHDGLADALCIAVYGFEDQEKLGR